MLLLFYNDKEGQNEMDRIIVFKINSGIIKFRETVRIKF